MDGRKTKSKKNEVLIVNGKGYMEDREKANQFAKTYKSFSKIPRDINDRNIKRVVRKALRRNQRPIAGGGEGPGSGGAGESNRGE